MLRQILSPIALATLMPACLATGMYRTAHVLPKNEGDVSLNFSVARVTTDTFKEAGVTVESQTFTYPNVVPEISYHYGVSDDVEVGGRAAFGAGMIEIDAKYRFVGGEGQALHLAVQPAVGYRSLGVVEGFQGSLPLIATYDLNEHISLNVAGFGTYTHYSVPSDFNGADDINLSGDNVMAGGAFGIQLETLSGFHFMPSIEVQRSVYRGGDAKGSPAFTVILAGVTLGWGADKTYVKVDKVEKKLDKLDDKLDKIDQKLDRSDSPPRL